MISEIIHTVDCPGASISGSPASSTLLFPSCLELPGAWHLLHTKSRQEKALSDNLASLGIPHYLPLVTIQRRYGDRKTTLQLPLFPGYVFLKGSLDQTYDADRTHRVARIIPIADQQKISWEIRNLALALSSRRTLDPYPFLTKGIRVEVRTGPFRGLQGVVEGRTRRDRLILQIEALGQATSLEIDGAVLEPLA